MKQCFELFCIPSRDYHYNIFCAKINLIEKHTKSRLTWLFGLVSHHYHFYLVWGNIFITKKFEIPTSQGIFSLFFFERVKMKRVWKCGNAPIKSKKLLLQGRNTIFIIISAAFSSSSFMQIFLWNNVWIH